MNPCARRGKSQAALRDHTAADVMTRSPISIREDAGVREALVLFTKKGFAAAAVIDSAGRALGVLSRSDLLVHERERRECLHCGPASTTAEGDANGAMRVRDLMTPIVFSVATETPIAKVTRDLLALHIHQLFVVDGGGVLVGVITPLDILRHLQPLLETNYADLPQDSTSN